MQRSKVLETLRGYFETKGRVLSAQEYSRETDTPIRLQQVQNIFGTWNRMEKLIMAREKPEAITDIADVLAARNKAASEADKAWREASENQDAKALREARANYVGELLAANAATPEGANANKIAIGGPLPQEQPKLERVGATVNVDPQTLEREIVNVEPEIVTTSNDDPRTPYELKRAVQEEEQAAAGAAKVSAGTVETGDETGGGSQGSASTSTVAALGGDQGDADKVADRSKVGANSTSATNTKSTPVTEKTPGK